MAKILITYYSRSGNTEKMATLIKEGVEKVTEDVELKKIEETTIDDLLAADAIIIGSPTYYGAMAAEIKTLLDKSVEYHGKFAGKIGGAFTSSANIGGGNETTIMSILQALLIHGMIIQGDSGGDHYGPVAIGAPDDRSKKICLRYGKTVATLAQRLK